MIKKLILKTLNKAGYGLIKLAPVNQAAQIITRGKSIINKISPEYKVLNGPFKGLQYPSLDITESTLTPKLVGSYESQLHPVVNTIINSNYTDLVDVGCAEGYYAVGFATKMPHTTVHGYDINVKDLNFCREMAKKNNVNNITFNTDCTPETVLNFNFKGRALILCDAEGYELELFSPAVIKSLKDTDLLIELHDVINPVISSEILTRFQYTHHLQIINNLNVDYSNLVGLEHLSQEDREFAVFEHRGGINQNIFMEWAFLTCK